MEGKHPKFNAETELRSDLWPTLSVNDLWLQRALLNSRMLFCQQVNNYPMANQMARGLKELDVYIEEKSNKEANLADAIVVR